MKTYEERKKKVDEIIEKYLPKEEGPDQTLLEAMNYSVRAGGKRLRPILLQAFGRMYGAPYALMEPFMAAIEFIHTYSLVHDDLPAMDNDMLRRGVPTTHAKYGEAMAILAGDALLTEAFNIMSETITRSLSDRKDPDRAMKWTVSASFATNFILLGAGLKGMIAGQSVDVETDKLGRDVDEEELMYIDQLKTGAMIESAMMAGVVLGGNSGDDINLASEAGEAIGLAFQIRDDILDITGDEKVLGKSTGQDAKNGKSTYASIHGIEDSEKAVKELTEEAKKNVRALQGVKNEEEREFVLSLFDKMTERNS